MWLLLALLLAGQIVCRKFWRNGVVEKPGRTLESGQPNHLRQNLQMPMKVLFDGLAFSRPQERTVLKRQIVRRPTEGFVQPPEHIT